MDENEIVWHFVCKVNSFIKLWLIQLITQIFPVMEASSHLNNIMSVGHQFFPEAICILTEGLISPVLPG